jgi:AcrR family transcriptional regulator
MDQTKMRILAAAARLFDIYGYHGTSVRKIAEEANVNVALISYHFRGKQGLLETLIASYFDTLFRLIREQHAGMEGLPYLQQLEQIIGLYVRFQCEHAAITRLIQRELSIESILAREVMTLYMARYKHGIAVAVEAGIHAGEFLPVEVEPVVLAVVSQILYPFLQPQMVRQIFDMEPTSEEFAAWIHASVMKYLRACLLADAGCVSKE